MSTMHDIYDPPPAPMPMIPPLPERINYRTSDLAILVGLGLGVVAVSVWAYTFEPVIAYLTLVGGAVVIVESWSTALSFLHKRPWMGLKGRWKIFVCALLPWLLGLGLAAAFMLSLFLVSDWAS